MSLPLLTRMRRSVWDAIDNWPELDGVFKKKLRFEDSQPMRLDDFVPAPGDCPCLWIAPTQADTPWIDNQAQEAQYTLDVAVWTFHASLPQQERLWQLLNRALWQSHPQGSTQPYIAAVTDKYDPLGPSQITLGAAAKGPVFTRWQSKITLYSRDSSTGVWNPRLDAGELSF